MLRHDIDSIDNRDPVALARAMALLDAPLRWYFRPTMAGLEKVPEGPALYVANHNGGPLTPDTFTFILAAHRALGIEAVPYGLAMRSSSRISS